MQRRGWSVLAACLGLMLSACGGLPPARSDAAPSATSTPPSDTPSPSIAALPAGADMAVTVPGVDVYGPMVGEGAIWARGIETGKLFRIDPDSGQVTTGATDRGCCLAIGEGAVWAPAPEAGTLERIAPDSGEVSDTFELGGFTVRAATGDGRVWVNSHRGGSVFGVDPSTGASTEVVVGPEGPGGPQQVYFAGGDVWVGIPNLGWTLVRVDPASGEIVASVEIPGAGCHTSAATDEYLWLAGGCWDSSPAYNTVWKIDLATNEVASEFQPGGTFSQWSQIAYADGAIWMVTTSGLLRIDGETDEATVVADDVLGPGSVASDDERLWVLTGSTSRGDDGKFGRLLLRLPIPRT